MDALFYRNPLNQYTIENVNRELVKAYTCFRIPQSLEQLLVGIATGNWGCGAFNGDRELKGINCQKIMKGTSAFSLEQRLFN